MGKDNKVIPFKKRKKMTTAESKKYAKQVDSYIKRTTPRIQEQLEHLIDNGLRLHEPNYTPAGIKGRVDSQPRSPDGSIRDYFLDGKIFLSVRLPIMDFSKNEQAVISISFRMFDLDGVPVDDNKLTVKGKAFNPLFDYLLLINLISRIAFKKRYKLLDPKDFIWCNSIDWYKLNGEILTMDDKDIDYYRNHFPSVDTTMHMHNLHKEHLDVVITRIFHDDLFPCFFEEVNND